MDYCYFHPTDKETEAQRLGNFFDIFHIQPALEEPRFRPREHRATMSHCLPGYKGDSLVGGSTSRGWTGCCSTEDRDESSLTGTEGTVHRSSGKVPCRDRLTDYQKPRDPKSLRSCTKKYTLLLKDVFV